MPHSKIILPLGRLLKAVQPVGLALVALAVLLGAFELGLRAKGFAPKNPADVEGSPSAPLRPSWRTHHALRPRHSLVRRNAETGEAVRLRTNSWGLRGGEPAVPKPPDLFRIVALGDERLLGADVPESKTACGHLQRLLQPATRLQVEVCNAGVPGYCPLLSYLQVKHSLLTLQPDLLILNFDMSDVADDRRYRRYVETGTDGEPLVCEHPVLQAEHNSQSPRFVIAEWGRRQIARLMTEADHPHEGRILDTPEGRYAWLRRDSPEISQYLRQALSPIGRLAEITDRLGMPFVLATYPAPWQLSSQVSAGRPNGIAEDTTFGSRRPFRLLGHYARRHGIHFCDASPAFRQARRPETLYLKNANRFSGRGHRLYAEELAAFLKQHVSGLAARQPPASWR